MLAVFTCWLNLLNYIRKVRLLVCWHYDYSKGRVVKGINFVSALFHAQQASLPVAMELAGKDQWVEDEKTERTKRRSSVTKNELFRRMVTACERNMAIDYVLADSWYCSAANIKHLTRKGLDWIMAIKSNRNIALSEQEKQNGIFTNIRSLDLEPGSEVRVWLKGLDQPMVLTKQVFKNEDDTEGTLYLVSNDQNLNYARLTALYKKRWCVEEYHKSLKNNSSLQASPTKVPRTQSNHCYLTVGAYLKMEKLKFRNNANHFALKTKIYLNATKAAMQKMQELSTCSGQQAV